jgi:hypothetical protein
VLLAHLADEVRRTSELRRVQLQAEQTIRKHAGCKDFCMSKMYAKNYNIVLLN